MVTSGWRNYTPNRIDVRRLGKHILVYFVHSDDHESVGYARGGCADLTEYGCQADRRSAKVCTSL